MKQEMPDFDALMRIAERNPQQLEHLRQQLAHDTINSAPKYMQRRLRGLQFKIDSTRAMAKTPLASCIQLTQMMHESFEELRSALNDPQPERYVEPLSTKAKIIAFNHKKKR